MKQVSYLLNRLMCMFGKDLVSVILFGSYARKNYTEFSDIDLIIVVEKEGKQQALKRLRMDCLLKFGRKVDIHLFTKNEIKANFRTFSPMFATLLLGKKILFDRGMFFRKHFECFVKDVAREEVRFCEGGKIWELNRIARGLEASL